MCSVPRHEFVSAEWRPRAYEDGPLPIGHGQTISQPYIVAVMTAALKLRGAETVLEIGTGCGYQAAVLSQLADRVYTMEVEIDLAATARERLRRLDLRNVEVLCGDGTNGLPEHAPFDAILIAAAAPVIPHPLLEQLNEGGRLIAPVGDAVLQELILVRKQDGKLNAKYGEGCRFVPLVGRYGQNSARE